MKVAVLGCGPAGLVATHAAVLAGSEVAILSKARKSVLHGAQYLHEPIPEITEEAPRLVHYRLQGTIDEYRQKVYGEQWHGKVSPDEYGTEQDHNAWDLRGTYDELWDMYGSGVQDVELRPDLVAGLVSKVDLVISTIPAPLLCAVPDQHAFQAQQVWAAGQQVGSDFPFHCHKDTIICNGEESPSWYRMARVFDHTTVEWPFRPSYSAAVPVNKPLAHTCTCLPQVLRVGRYGAWQKGLLVHDAFEAVYRHLTTGKPLVQRIREVFSAGPREMFGAR
jgi:hypothetical protein